MIYALLVKIIFGLTIIILSSIVILYASKNKKEMMYFGVLIVAGVFISAPAFYEGVLSGHDVAFHYGRLYGIRDGLLNGEFFVKMQQNWLNGHGYILGVFYGDYLLYIPAVLNILGMEMEAAYQTFWLIINFITLFAAYFSFKAIFKSSQIAVIGSIIYSCNIYRLMDMYIRHAVGEYCAFIFLPLVALGFYKVFSQEDNEYGKLNYGWLILSIAFSGLINTHILSCEIVAIFCILLFVVLFRQFREKRIWKYAALTVITSLLLSASFLVPFVDGMFIKGNTNVSDAGRNLFSLEDRGIMASHFRELLHREAGSRLNLDEGIAITFIFSAMLIGGAIVLGLMIRNADRMKMIVFYGVFGVLALFMTTKYFPWDTIRQIPYLENVISSIQYPWRFLAAADLFAVLSLAEALKGVKEKEELRGKWFYAVSVFILLLAVIPTFGYINDTGKRTKYVSFNHKEELDFMNIGEKEYLPIGTDISSLTNEIAYTGELEITNYQKKGLHISFDVKSLSEGRVKVPLIHYWYYKCTLDGKSLPVYAGENNMVTIDVPADADGRVEVYWKNPISWEISFVITLITSILISLFILMKYFKNIFVKAIDILNMKR